MVQKEAAEVNPFNRTRLPRQPEITCGIGGYRGGHHLANLSAPVVYTSESDVERRPEFGNVQVRSWVTDYGIRLARHKRFTAGGCLDCPAQQSHALVAMEVETKFLRLFKPVALGDRIDGWRVCWIGGWDKCRVLFVVMIERPRPNRSSGRRAANT